MRFMVTLTPKADLGDPISQLLGAEQPRWRNCDKLAFLSNSLSTGSVQLGSFSPPIPQLKQSRS